MRTARSTVRSDRLVIVGAFLLVLLVAPLACASNAGRQATATTATVIIRASATTTSQVSPSSTASLRVATGVGLWKDLHPSGDGLPLEGGFQSVGSVFDLDTERVLLFGVGVVIPPNVGSGLPYYFGRVDTFDGVSGRLSDDLGLGIFYVGAFAGRSEVYDPEDDQIILFGGRSVDDAGNPGAYVSDTVSCDSHSLVETKLSPVGVVPSPRAGQSMVYAASTREVIMFGGSDGSSAFSDTWSYDVRTNTWTKRTPAGAVPPARSGQSMVYAASTHRVIMFGGTDNSVSLADTWSYDPAANTWTELRSSGEGPSARNSQAMAYDPLSGEILMFGGKNDAAALADTWVFDPVANTWNRVFVGGAAPASQLSESMVYDAACGAVTLFEGAGTGGVSVWRYEDREPSWTRVEPSGTLPLGPLVYDTSSGEAILFGSTSTSEGPVADLGEVWRFDPTKNAWSERSRPQQAPPARGGFSLVYDPVTHKVILFGGIVGPGTLDDLWVYDPSAGTWTPRQPSGTVPSPRIAESLVCDTDTGMLIMFGGTGANRSETWSYDPRTNHWTDLHPEGGRPSGAVAAAAVYVPSLHEVVLFGGSASGTAQSETWAFDPASDRWRNLHPAGAAPAARVGASMVYDAARREVIMLGGETAEGASLGGIWVYDPSANRWTDLVPDTDRFLASTGGAEPFFADVLDKVLMVGAANSYSDVIAGTWALTR